MVRVKFKLTPERRELSMRVSGHAGAGPKGFDVVCAGASMYAFGIAQVIKNMDDEGKLEQPPVIQVDTPGRVVVSCVPKKAYFGEALHTFYVAQTGFRLLSEAYPDHAALIPFETSLKGDSK